MINRIIHLLLQLGLVLFVLLIALLYIPVYIATGKNTLDWLDIYLDFLYNWEEVRKL